MKHSFGVLKPDCVRRNLVNQAFKLIRSSGLKVIFSKKLRFEPKDAEFLYFRCRNSYFFESLIKFMTSGEVVIYIVEARNGECAINILNEIVGHTDPTKAKPGTLRSLGIDVCENITHSTADEKSFQSEVMYFLNNEEIKRLKLVL
ncbi:MAG: hypothetical protein HYT68_00480 [Candidatus Zambryskibacteria bacterium]|nr:hypothetical protein [Candidatus Zambryskibacteria bacterium]